jgi:hypothetical protein
MGLDRTWILAAAFFGFSCCPAVAQNTENSPAVPERASVGFQKEMRLHTGQEFPFRLTLFPTPLLYPHPTENNHRPRRVTALFVRVGGPSTNSDEEAAATVSADLLDGQSIYDMSLRLQPWKLTGQWKLDSVSINWKGETKLRILDDVSFEMLELEPISIQINAPPTVEAGKKYSFTVTLDKFPSDMYPGCNLHVEAQLGPEGTLRFEGDEPRPNKLAYVFSHRFEPDDRSGPRQLVVRVYEFNEGYRQQCGDRLVRGDRTFTFVVEPARGVQIPTSAAVSVNPAQIQLLLGKIDHLNAEVQQLKEQVKETSPHIRR